MAFKVNEENFDSIFLFLVALVLSVFLFFVARTISNPEFISAFILAGFLGGIVGMSEIVSRYRDEPLRACRSYYGFIYIFINMLLALGGLLLIWSYPVKFGFEATPDPILSGLAAGLGASAVMRSRLLVLKGPDNKDISIGPDLVIKYLMTMVDQYIDRQRATHRFKIVSTYLPSLVLLGKFQVNEYPRGPEPVTEFKAVADYFSTTLLALQNLDSDSKKNLGDTFSNYDRQPLPVNIKYLAMGFVFLTVVGEYRFRETMGTIEEDLQKRQGKVSLPATANPSIGTGS